MPLRLVFMGTPDFAVPALVEIGGRGYDVAAVYTRAPKPAGRGLDLQPSPVERAARRLGIPVLTPKTLRTSDAEASMREHAADAAVVVAYGLILPKAVLDVFPLGAFNVHASLLPRWRGAAPISRAIMAGDQETGVTIMRMEEGLDTGPMAVSQRVPIGADETASDLHDRLAEAGANLMVRALGAIERGSLGLTPQPPDGVTYAEKIAKSETRIDWTLPAPQVHDHIRGLSSFPGAWFEFTSTNKPVRVKALRTTLAPGSGAPGALLDEQFTVACGDGAVRLMELQRAGGQPMKADQFLRGTTLTSGARLG